MCIRLFLDKYFSMPFNIQKVVLNISIIIYSTLFLLALLARFEWILTGRYNLRYTIWVCWNLISFGSMAFLGYKLLKGSIERHNLPGSKKVLVIIIAFIIGINCMGIIAALRPRISKNDIKHFLRTDYGNFEKVNLIKNDIFKQHADIHKATYYTTVRQSNYWQIKNLVGDWLDYDLSVYDINKRLSNITEDNEVKAIDFSMSEIKYYFNGYSNLILIRADSKLPSEYHLENIGHNYYIREKVDKEEENQ